MLVSLESRPWPGGWVVFGVNGGNLDHSDVEEGPMCGAEWPSGMLLRGGIIEGGHVCVGEQSTVHNWITRGLMRPREGERG
jgi:hypothetical protein